MAVITLSRQLGSGGDEIAALVCQIAGYRLCDKHMFERAAVEAGLTDQEIIDFSEENYKVKSFFERLFEPRKPLAEARIWTEDASGARILEQRPLTAEHALFIAQQAIHTAYQLGDALILGRGGQIVLKEYPDVLHVRVEAPLEDRLLRVRNGPKMVHLSFGNALEERRYAQKLIEESDQLSASYLEQYYQAYWADPGLYHLVLNTGKLDYESAAQTLIAAGRQLEKLR